MDKVNSAFEMAEGGNLGMLKHYIESGIVPLDVVNDEQQTLAHIAARNDDVTIFKFLIDKDPSLLQKYGRGEGSHSNTFIQFAIKHGSRNVVRYLVENRYAEIFSKDKGEADGKPGYGAALIWAIRSGRLPILEYLIDKENIDVNSPPGESTLTLLINAMESCDRDIIKFLIEEKNMTVPSLEGNVNCGVHAVVRNCDLHFLKFILDEVKVKVDINQQDSSGYTLVHEALLNDKMDMLAYLVDNKQPNLNIGSKDTNETPLYYAVRGSESMCEYLVEHGADVNWQNHEGNTPLLSASSDEICVYLIKKGANVNQTNNNGDTPLHRAIKTEASGWSRHQSWKYLIQYGANVNLANNQGQTPLHVAVDNENSPNSLKACKQLVKSGADVNHKDNNGETPVYRAAIRNRMDVLEYLVSQKQTDINAAAKNGQTPLHGAAVRGRERVCEYLIKRGADVNSRDNFGWTPLHFAASNGHYKVCEYLVKHGADIGAKNNSGKLPKEEASDSRLIEYMENVSNSSKVKRNRRNAFTYVPSFLWSNSQPFEYTRQKTMGVQMCRSRDCLNGGPLSASFTGMRVPQFQNFLTLTALLFRDPKNSTSSQPSGAVSSEKIDYSLAEISVNSLPQFEGR